MIPLIAGRRKKGFEQKSFSAEAIYDLNIGYEHWHYQGEARPYPGSTINLTMPQFESFGSMVWQEKVNPRCNWVTEFSIGYNFVSFWPTQGVCFFLAENWIGPLPKPEWPTRTQLASSCYKGKLLGLYVDASYTWNLVADYDDGVGLRVLKSYTYNPPYEYFTVRLIYDHSRQNLRLVVNGVYVIETTVDASFLPEEVMFGLHGCGLDPSIYPSAGSSPAYNTPRVSWTTMEALPADIETQNLFDDFNRAVKPALPPWEIPNLWSPSQLSLRAWYDPSQAQGVSLLGPCIEVLYDLSGNGRHATQSQISACPQLVYSPFNFRKAMRFDGAQTLFMPDGIANDSTSLCMTFRSDFGPGQYYISPDFGQYQGDIPNEGRVSHIYMLEGPRSITSRGWGAQFNSGISRPGNNYPHAWNTLYNRQVGVYNSGTLLYSDGHAFNCSSSYTGWTTALLGSGFAGWIGELILIDGEVTPENRQRLEGYLGWKWGMRDRLPVDHPYRATPPQTQSGQ